MTIQAIGLRPEWDFCDRLRKVRRVMGWTQPEMAAALHVKPARYGHWEAGRNLPDDLHITAMAISMITGVDLGWLLGQDSPNGDGGAELLHLDSNQEPCDSPLAQVLRLHHAA